MTKFIISDGFYIELPPTITDEEFDYFTNLRCPCIAVLPELTDAEKLQQMINEKFQPQESD